MQQSIYIWEAIGRYYDGEKIFKIGITGSHRDTARIAEVARSHGDTPKIIVCVPVRHAEAVEKSLLAFGRSFKDIGNGSTEFRAMNDVQLRKCIDFINQYLIDAKPIPRPLSTKEVYDLQYKNRMRAYYAEEKRLKAIQSESNQRYINEFNRLAKWHLEQIHANPGMFGMIFGKPKDIPYETKEKIHAMMSEAGWSRDFSWSSIQNQLMEWAKGYDSRNPLPQCPKGSRPHKFSYTPINL